MVRIESVVSPADLDDAWKLFEEYAASLGAALALAVIAEARRLEWAHALPRARSRQYTPRTCASFERGLMAAPEQRPCA